MKPITKYESLSDQLQADRLARGTIILVGSIAVGSASILLSEMLAARHLSDKGRLTVYLDSSGGVVHEALAMHDIIKGVVAQGMTVDVVGLGTVASAAVAVMQAASNRLTLPNTQFMLHEVSRTAAPYSSESQSETADSAREMLRLQTLVYEIIANRAGLPIIELRKRVGKRVKWLSAQEALDWHLIDGFTSVTL